MLVAPDIPSVTLHPVHRLLAADCSWASHTERPDTHQHGGRGAARACPGHGGRGAGRLPNVLRHRAGPRPVARRAYLALKGAVKAAAKACKDLISNACSPRLVATPGARFAEHLVN